MVTILKDVLLGILLYVAVIPILEELATVIVQGLEVVKGWLIVILGSLQEKADRQKEKLKTHAIGFSIPDDEEEYEEENDEDDCES